MTTRRTGNCCEVIGVHRNNVRKSIGADHCTVSSQVTPVLLFENNGNGDRGIKTAIFTAQVLPTASQSPAPGG